tara:strand:+ start:76 stop:381 length:306 start_codon:yes stop_codon:yes gene_type:complete
MPAKVHIVGKNIFDNTRLETILPSSSIVQVPIVRKKNYTLIDISDDLFVSMIDENNNVKEDLKMSEDMYEKIKDKIYDHEILLTSTSAMGREEIMDYKMLN